MRQPNQIFGHEGLVGALLYERLPELKSNGLAALASKTYPRWYRNARQKARAVLVWLRRVWRGIFARRASAISFRCDRQC